MQNVPNPFMVLLQPCFEPHVPSEISDQLLFVLEVVRAQFLVLPQQPLSLLPTLQFLKNVVEKIQCQCTPHLLNSMLSCLLSCDMCSRQTEPQGIRKHAMQILRPLLHTCHYNTDTL